MTTLPPNEVDFLIYSILLNDNNLLILYMFSNQV